MAHQVGHDEALACQASPLRQHLDEFWCCKVMQKKRRDHEIDTAFSKRQSPHITLNKSDLRPGLQAPPRPPQMCVAKV